MGKIIKVAGPLVVAEGMNTANIYDVCMVGKNGLIGEVNRDGGDKASIRVYKLLVQDLETLLKLQENHFLWS